MGDNTSAGIQKIKERLFELGQLDIDDSAINELVTSCHPFCNTEEIIELIVGAPDCNNTVCYKNSNTVDTHIKESHKNSNDGSTKNDGKTESKLSTTILNEAGVNMENVNKETEKIANTVQDRKTEYSNDNMLESSDFDSEDDNYYENLYTDDNFDFFEDNNVSDENRDMKDFLPRNGLLNGLDSFSVEVHNETTCVLQSSAKTIKTYNISSSSDSETMIKTQIFDFQTTNNSSSQPLAHLNLIGYTSSAHIVHKDSTEKSVRADEVELLEENNNDPNNNLDSVQLQSGSSPEFIDLSAQNPDGEVTIISDRENSPQPSCSKDFNPQPSRIKLVLRRETNQILSLLPRFNYGLVFRTLNKYRDASNRIECALKEILLSERPVPEFYKRKSMEDICTIKSKKCHSEEDHSSHMHKRKDKNRKRIEFNDTEDCILITENADTKNKDKTNLMNMQSCETKVNSEGAMTDVSKAISPKVEQCRENDNLIYHTADEGTPGKASEKVDSELVLKETGSDITIPSLQQKIIDEKVDSELVLKETGSDITIPSLQQKIIDASVTNVVTATAMSSTTDVVKSTTASTSGNSINVSLINEEKDTLCSLAMVNNKGNILPKNIMLTTETENNQTSVESSITHDIMRTANDTELNITQNIVKDNANSPQQKIENDKVENTINAKKDPSIVPTSMDLTINCTSSGSLNVGRDMSLTVTSQDNKLIVSGGIDASIKSGILKAPKLIIKGSVQSTIPIAKSSNNILAPPKLVCTVNNMKIYSAHGSVTPILTPAKLINSEKNKDKSSVAKADKAAVTVPSNCNLSQNVAKEVTLSCTSKHTMAEQNTNYVKPKDNTIERPGTSKAGSKDDTELYKGGSPMSHLESMYYVKSIPSYENQKEMGNKKTITNRQEKVRTMLLPKNVRSQGVKMFETVQGNMNAINNATEIIAGPSTIGCICKNRLTFSPVTKDSQQTPNTAVSSRLINSTSIGGTKEPRKTKEPDSTVLKPAFVKYYYPILSMFPDVDPTYIKGECKKFISSSQATAYEENEQFNRFVEHLLNTGSQHPRVHPKLEDNNEDNRNYDVKECYLDLLDLFPNADPNYLREKAEWLYDKPEERKIFIQSKIDKPDYPTREEYIAKKQISEQQKQYTTNFSVTKFLEICPDPVSQFENRQRQCTFQEKAFEFLNYRFSQFRKDTLRRVYRSNNFNLSLTAKELDDAHPDRKTKRHIPQFLATENIPLLQEMAFITHKAELLEHIHNLNMEEAEEFKRLKEQNELLQCQCCFDSEVMPSKCASCDEGHIFCNQCIRTGVETKLGDGETHIQCFLDCGNEFSISVLQSVLTPTKFSILLQKRQEAEVMAAGLEGLVSCPFCHFASIPPPEDKVFKCLNPECMKETCRLCKELNHVPLKCEEANAENVRHILEEKMTEALIRKCYKCKRPFFKEEGCNRMTCICGAVMCYICDKPIKNGYEHFSGQGSVRTDLCPLWSDNRRINAQTVAIAAEEAVKELRKVNPKVQIDARTLVPQVPQSSKGPHNDIPHSNIIPKRAYSLSKDNR